MNATDKLRTVVVDDEGLAREELCFLLGQIPGIEVVAQAGDGPAALEVISEQQPDLVMLDVQMPGLTGFEVARRLLRGGSEAHLVFVTLTIDTQSRPSTSTRSTISSSLLRRTAWPRPSTVCAGGC